MRLPKAVEMQALDKCAIDDFGIPGIVLMENAGLGTVRLMEEEIGSPKNSFALIFIGPGNNGGDGLVIGRHLHQRGCEPIFFFLVNPDLLTGDAATNLNIIRQLKLPFHVIDTETRVKTIPVLFKQIESRGKPCYAVVDAIFGTGLTRPVEGRYADVINLINKPDFAHGIPIVSVDVPSGMDSDKGSILGTSIKSDYTATYGCAKPGHVIHGGSELIGKLVVVDIGIPPEAIAKLKIPTKLITTSRVSQWLATLHRKKYAHKGDSGHLLVLAGSAGKTGAAILAARGALHGGCGLVSLCVPANLNTIFEVNLVEAMTIPLSSPSILTMEDVATIEKNISGKSALVLGPGIGTNSRTAELVLHLYHTVTAPLILDADALNILAKYADKLHAPKGPRILTPHPGELARMLNVTPAEIQDDRMEAARQAVEKYAQGEHEFILVLKGAGTVIAYKENKVMVNTSGNPNMATGGMGDVLTGIIGALICQGLLPREAAGAGVFLHGAAGDILSEEKGFGFTASELAEQLPSVIKHYQD